MKLLIKKGTVIDPSINSAKVLDVLIDGSKIKEISPNIVDGDAHIINAENKLVVPGLIDAHVHFREPGLEYKEDIHTGSKAAAAGGFTTVIAEPNTIPPIDTASRLRNVLDIAKVQSMINFYSKACITSGSKGERITFVSELKRAGAMAISDDGNPVPTRRLMRNALKKGKEFGILVTPHCEESEYYLNNKKEKNKKQFREPYTAELDFILRDIEEAEQIGARLHISHISLAESVKVIAKAKKRGVNITAEAAPHHFLLSKDDVEKIGSNAKVNPPLRSKKDVEAIKQGLADGTVDIIASDHAPHSLEEKDRSYNRAPFGLIGLETTLGLVITYLVRPGILSINKAIEKLTIAPAKIFGLDKVGIGSLTPGTKANITIIDLEKKWQVDVRKFYSKARNCPFDGWKLQGKAIMTILGNRIVMKDDKIIDA